MNIRKIEPFKIFRSNSKRVKSLDAKTKFLLVGNPNTGKTTLFNSLTKSNEHVGNWHGVTVSEKEKVFDIEGKECVLVDLPGLYSLTPLSFEEEVASEYIFENSSCPVINICDINNLRRNLFLTLQLKKIANDFLLFVNTFKSSKKDKVLKEKIDEAEKVLKKLGVKFFIGDASNKKDIKKFKIQLSKTAFEEKSVGSVKNEFSKNREDFLEVNGKAFKEISKLFEDKIETKKVYGTSKLDKILLNKYLALPVFFCILFLIFYLTFFSLGACLSNLMRELIQDVIGSKIVELVKGATNVAWVIDLVETGIIGGVGSVLAFLPQVILLFFFLSLIEDSGYLARVAFLFEDIFSKVGLSGKSVYTLLMGFGCSTTASLTARNMEDKNAKIKTALLTPYMSCSAKLPIYAVIGGAFFGASNIFIIFGLYMLGVLVAVLLSSVLEQKVLKSKSQSFILEFPAYRIPSMKRVFNILWENVKLFLIRIGTIIFALNIVVWILQSFSFTFKFVQTDGGTSMLASIGSFLAPAFVPLGFGNWGAVSALVAGLVAKEVIVSSIAMFNGVNVSGDSLKSQTMRSILDPLAVVSFTPASALSFMIFCLLYSPCLATISVFKKEIGTKWTVISIVVQLMIAYLISFFVFNLYKLVELIGVGNGIAVLIAIVAISISVIALIGRLKKKRKCNGCCGNCEKCQK
ncbi:MAG: ferrous iron transport protein B [Firmicutes bacterium]|nr:ferrous iron transport protein B [Bacillota bacterium]MDY3658872.1 ferrous iron transport protein B [Eubacteriales bacterium]